MCGYGVVTQQFAETQLGHRRCNQDNWETRAPGDHLEKRHVAAPSALKVLAQLQCKIVS